MRSTVQMRRSLVDRRVAYSGSIWKDPRQQGGGMGPPLVFIGGRT